MKDAKITIPIGPKLLRQLDRMVKNGFYSNRSHAILSALMEGVTRMLPNAAVPKDADVFRRPSFNDRKWPEY